MYKTCTLFMGNVFNVIFSILSLCAHKCRYPGSVHNHRALYKLLHLCRLKYCCRYYTSESCHGTKMNWKNTQINETLWVAFNEMYVPILSGSAEALYVNEDCYVWELVTHASGTHGGHTLFCKIPLKIFICIKALHTGISCPHHWTMRKTSQCA